MKNFLIQHYKKIIISASLITLCALLGFGIFWTISKTDPLPSTKDAQNNLSVTEANQQIMTFPEISQDVQGISDTNTQEAEKESSEEETSENTEGPSDDPSESQEENSQENEPEKDSNEEEEILPLLPKNHGPDELRIGFLTDLHAKSNSGESKSDRVIKTFFEKIIDTFIKKMNNDFVADFLLLNGDVIEGTGRDSIIGIGELQSLKKMFDLTQIKKYWVVGNHDLRSVNKKQWKEALGIDYTNKSFDIGDYRIIILDSNFDNTDKDIEPGDYYTRGNVSQKQIKWLKKELDTKKTKVVFMHHPPLQGVDFHSGSGLPLNAPELREIFSENNVTAVFSGHIENFHHEKTNGVEYYTLPGATRSEEYQGTFAEIKIKNGKVDVTMYYLNGKGEYKSKNVTD